MDFSLPAELLAYLSRLDDFIDNDIRPLEQVDDNCRFFDHRREWARTDFNRDGLPAADWEKLLDEVKARADRAGFYRFALPAVYGGSDGSNLWMAVIREHLAAKGLGLHNDLQNEHSIVGNFPFAAMLHAFGSEIQKRDLIVPSIEGAAQMAFALTEPEHGSDVTHMETTAVREERDGLSGWRIDGEKIWTTNMHRATHVVVFARSSGERGSSEGITAFLVPAKAAGLTILQWMWTFNMPTDHPHIRIDGVWIPDDACIGPPEKGLQLAQAFVHENRIRQAASSLGATAYCLEQSVLYANARRPFGRPLSANQAIQWPLVELATQVEMLRQLIRKTAWEMDRVSPTEIASTLSDKVSMCNFWANRMVCQAADFAMQVHGGIGYSRHKPFEHIYRHHRRYRITEGAEEIQIRKIAGWLFGYAGPNKS